MIQRALASRGFIALVLAWANGPRSSISRWLFLLMIPLLRLIAIRQPLIFEVFHWSCTLFLFTTPYIVYSLVFSGLYVFALRPRTRPKALPLPPFPRLADRNDLFLVLGEVHDPRRPQPSGQPYWMTVPERGLFTGIAIFGAIGTGKTSGCMYPYAEQLIAYRAGDSDRRIGGLVLEVKGDFCHKVREILERITGEKTTSKSTSNADYRYNPLYNDLDAYALAYNIASLLNNLFGKGKEPFWQQAYTNLVKFIIQLHKVAYDYVTLFDVYECAINPELLEKRIREAERRFNAQTLLRHRERTTSSTIPSWRVSASRGTSKPKPTRRLSRSSSRRGSAAADIEYECQTESQAVSTDPLKREILEGVKRWFYQDWRRIENKLRTSIVEGISVFLSLFDDNPMVKRTFCPPKECYDPQAQR